MNVSRLLWLKDAPAVYTFVNERQLRRLVADKKIRSFRVGRKVYLAPEDLEKLPIEVPSRGESAAGRKQR